MGGAPKISGGMTYAEQQKLLVEEREFQKQQEEERRKLAEDAETRRYAREKIEQATMKAEEQAAIQTSQSAEQQAIAESQAQDDSQQMQGMQGSTTKTLDFYSSLYNGMNNT